MAKIRRPPTDPVEIVAEDAPTGSITIEIEEPTPDAEIEVAPEKVPPIAEPTPADDDPVKKALEATQRAEELQRQVADANRRAEEAARTAREREAELHRERGDRVDAEYNSILTAIAAETAAIEQAEAAYAAAATNGDWATAGKAQRAMATSSARLDRLEDNKVAYDSRREEEKKAPTRETRQQPADFETQTSNLPAEARDWLRKHQDYWTDPAKNRQVTSVHGYLVDIKRLPPFSKEYFDELDVQLGLKAAPAVAEPHQPQPPQPQRRSMPVSAPPSRDVPTPSGHRTSNNRITLTPEERDIARRSFTASDMTDEQKERLYAMNKSKLLRMRANGQYRHTTEETG